MEGTQTDKKCPLLVVSLRADSIRYGDHDEDAEDVVISGDCLRTSESTSAPFPSLQRCPDLRPQAKQCASTCSRLSRLPAPRSSGSSDTTPLSIHFSGPLRHLPRSGLCFRCKGQGQDGSARAGPSRAIKLSHCFAVCFSAGVAYRAKRYRYLKPQAEEKSISS